MPSNGYSDEWVRLLYVAATRAKKELLVLSYGRPSPFLA